MKLLIQVVFILALLFPLSAHAEIKVITHTVQQPFGGSQSPDDARTAGIARAKREALERFGTYIESSTVVKNSQVDSDEILALTAGVTKAEVVKQKNYTEGDAFGLEITVKVELDTSVLDQSLKRLLQDRNHLKDLKDARVREKQLLARIAELEKENQQKGKTEKQQDTLKKEFAKTRDGLTAVEWYNKALALWDGEKYTAPKKTIEYITKAIKLNSTDAAFYNNRGLAYADLKQYQQAIKDYDQAIQLYPTFALVYNNRGNAYADLNQHQRAIKDYDQAIRLDPNLTLAYNNRGATYIKLVQFQEAIADYTQTISLSPTNPKAYFGRGRAYDGLQQNQQAIDDYTQAISLDSTYAKAYNNRGVLWMNSGDDIRACQDLSQACKLGACNGYDYSLKKRICQ